MLPCQSSGVRRMGREGRESRVQRSSVQGREVLIVIVIVIMVRNSLRAVAREHERTRERNTESTDDLPAPGLRGVGSSSFVLRRAFGRSHIHPHVSGARVHENSMFVLVSVTR